MPIPAKTSFVQPQTQSQLLVDLKVVPLSPCIGAEIEGIDLCYPLTRDEQATLDLLRQRYKVLCFRNQSLTVEQLIRFASQFGELEQYVSDGLQAGRSVHQDYPELVSFCYNTDYPGRENFWHYDIAPQGTPYAAAILRAVQVPELGGDTLFTDVGAAYRALSQEMKQTLAGLVALNDYLPIRRIARAKGMSEATLACYDAIFPIVEAPLVQNHPVTGEPILWVNSTFTIRIKDLPDAESRSLLNHLTEHYKLPEFQCRFRWTPNAIAFWDNWACQHYAINDYYPQTRIMERLSLVSWSNDNGCEYK
ncbi:MULTISPECIES: TauD/TfdA dioxygenase family protein [Leptolyngbya]|uniref:TauD/TfdA dioxygenase family protein n=1 Tax=Leptolyngbya TaxID=47251 RepID=UPI001685761F|nr:TauD/TfdA family dioxygenase [Leptolyngbya sp. FACHB-1624]MBD1856125.1 TauD/TfdA family dioxygenase [Leptolyngbya sp. FACHB-1624]